MQQDGDWCAVQARRLQGLSCGLCQADYHMNASWQLAHCHANSAGLQPTAADLQLTCKQLQASAVNSRTMECVHRSAGSAALTEYVHTGNGLQH